MTRRRIIRFIINAIVVVLICWITKTQTGQWPTMLESTVLWLLSHIYDNVDDIWRDMKDKNDRANHSCRPAQR